MKLEESEDEKMRDDDVEYVFESIEVKDAGLDEFSNVFARFKPPPESASVRWVIWTLVLELTFVITDG